MNNTYLVYFVDISSKAKVAALIFAMILIFFGLMLKLISASEDSFKKENKLANRLLTIGGVCFLIFIFIPRSDILLNMLGG